MVTGDQTPFRLVAISREEWSHILMLMTKVGPWPHLHNFPTEVNDLTLLNCEREHSSYLSSRMLVRSLHVMDKVLLFRESPARKLSVPMFAVPLLVLIMVV